MSFEKLWGCDCDSRHNGEWNESESCSYASSLGKFNILNFHLIILGGG